MLPEISGSRTYFVLIESRKIPGETPAIVRFGAGNPCVCKVMPLLPQTFELDKEGEACVCKTTRCKLVQSKRDILPRLHRTCSAPQLSMKLAYRSFRGSNSRPLVAVDPLGQRGLLEKRQLDSLITSRQVQNVLLLNFPPCTARLHVSKKRKSTEIDFAVRNCNHHGELTCFDLPKASRGSTRTNHTTVESTEIWMRKRRPRRIYTRFAAPMALSVVSCVIFLLLD